MDSDADSLSDLFDTVSLGGPEKAVGFVLWRLIHRYQRAVDRALEPLDLTHLQFTTLTMAGWLCRTGESVTQAELARHAAIHPMQVSLMLKALEAKKMVSRPRSGTDARARLIGITPAGVASLRQALPTVIAIQQRLFGDDGAPGGALLARLLEIEARAE